jgi:feruloyl esterase
MIGNGGYAGEDLESVSRQRSRDGAVAAGFVFTQTNTGHDAAIEPLGSFAVNPQKLVDYTFRAVHVTVETAKRIAAAYYGQAPKRSYWLGCSTGGRQGLMAAQRFPADFDGIVAGAPVLDFVGTVGKYTQIMSAMARGPLTEEKFRLVGKAVYEKCDGIDGVRDGLIEDPRRCGFKPVEHLSKCGPSGERADCFTDAQIATLDALYSDQHVAGKRVFPGWPVGVEAEGANGSVGWVNWLVATNRPPLGYLFAETFFRYLAFPEKRPDLALLSVDLDKSAPRLEPIRQMLNATDPDLTAFKDRGGKLLMTFGWADPALNPNMGVEYYESVMATMGPGTRDFFRLFMMPGVFHCAGGPGCDTVATLATVIDWVERGRAPATITAAKVVDGRTIRTRPLCPYPEVARYKGSGSTDEAGNFACGAGQVATNR